MARQIKYTNINPIWGLLILVLFLMGLYFITKSLFTLLAWIAPVLFVITLIVDYKVVLGFGKSLIGLVKKNPLYGIGAIVLSVLGIHLVVAYLFGKAMLKSKIRKMAGAVNRPAKDEYVEFEEVEDLELKNLTPPLKETSQYDELLDQ